MASLGVRPAAAREEVLLADPSLPAARHVRIGFLPKRLEGGTLVRMSESSREVRASGGGREGEAVMFETSDVCNVYVCVHLELVLSGAEPSWLKERGFRMCTDCVVAAARAEDGFFAVYRSAAVSPALWRLGNNATDVPVGRRVPGKMYFVVVTRLDLDDTFGVRLATDPASISDRPEGAIPAAASSSSAAGAAGAGGAASPPASMLGAVASTLASLWG